MQLGIRRHHAEIREPHGEAAAQRTRAHQPGTPLPLRIQGRKAHELPVAVAACADGERITGSTEAQVHFPIHTVWNRSDRPVGDWAGDDGTQLWLPVGEFHPRDRTCRLPPTDSPWERTGASRKGYANVSGRNREAHPASRSPLDYRCGIQCLHPHVATGSGKCDGTTTTVSRLLVQRKPN